MGACLQATLEESEVSVASNVFQFESLKQSFGLHCQSIEDLTDLSAECFIINLDFCDMNREKQPFDCFLQID